MKTRACGQFGMDFPLFAFSHCRDVVVAVSKAGGFGVMGLGKVAPEEVEAELNWIDAHIDGRPYGVDLVVPQHLGVERTDKSLTTNGLRRNIPKAYFDFADELLKAYDINPAMTVDSDSDRPVMMLDDVIERQLDAVFNHPVRMVVQAMGLAPQFVLDRAHAHGVPVAAQIGSAEHAKRQIERGVDVVIAAGAEAGGHCGEISTMVLVPEVAQAIDTSKTMLLAGGGIVTGRQMAAVMAMGAHGAWTGSVWLTTVESDVPQVVREKLLASTSRDSIRTKSGTGKFAGQLRTPWSEAWERRTHGLDILPMPYQPEIRNYVMDRAAKSYENGNEKAREIITYLVGQGVGMMNEVKSTRSIVHEFREDYIEAVERMQALVE